MKKITKIVAFAAAAAMLTACFTGCGKKGKTLEQVKSAGELVIATSPDFPPFEELNNGNVEGIEIDLLNLICEKLGVKLKIEQMDFDSVLPGVQAAKYDVGVSGITITPDREKNTLFTDSYCLAEQSIVVTENSPIKAKADLDGKKISVQSGTTAEEFCGKQGYALSSFQANSDAQTALTTGKVDAWVIDNLTAIEMVAAYNAENDSKLVILDEAMTTEPYAFACCFGSEDLVAEINKVLADLLKDGTVKGIFEKYDAPYVSPTENN